MDRAVPLIQNSIERGDRYFKLPRDSDESAGTDKSQCCPIKNADTVGRKLQQFEEMKPLIAGTVIIIQTIGVYQKPIFMRPTILGEIWCGLLHFRLQTKICII